MLAVRFECAEVAPESHSVLDELRRGSHLLWLRNCPVGNPAMTSTVSTGTVESLPTKNENLMFVSPILAGTNTYPLVSPNMTIEESPLKMRKSFVSWRKWFVE